MHDQEVTTTGHRRQSLPPVGHGRETSCPAVDRPCRSWSFATIARDPPTRTSRTGPRSASRPACRPCSPSPTSSRPWPRQRVRPHGAPTASTSPTNRASAISSRRSLTRAAEAAVRRPPSASAKTARAERAERAERAGGPSLPTFRANTPRTGQFAQTSLLACLNTERVK